MHTATKHTLWILTALLIAPAAASAMSDAHHAPASGARGAKSPAQRAQTTLYFGGGIGGGDEYRLDGVQLGVASRLPITTSGSVRLVGELKLDQFTQTRAATQLSARGGIEGRYAGVTMGVGRVISGDTRWLPTLRMYAGHPELSLEATINEVLPGVKDTIGFVSDQGWGRFRVAVSLFGAVIDTNPGVVAGAEVKLSDKFTVHAQYAFFGDRSDTKCVAKCDASEEFTDDSGSALRLGLGYTF